MTSAFNWSPGGCCCTQLAEWYDAYWARLEQTEAETTSKRGTLWNFVRESRIGRWPVHPDNSYLANVWHIQPADRMYSNSLRASGQNLTSEVVWSHEWRGTEKFVLYDAVTKQEKFVLDLADDLNGLVPLSGVSDTRCGYFQPQPGSGGTIIEVDDAGQVSIQSYGGNRTYSETRNVSEVTGVWDNIIHAVGARSWPRVCYAKSTIIKNKNQSTGAWEITNEWGAADVSVVAGQIQLSNRVVMLTRSYSYFDSNPFDTPGGGLIAANLPGWTWFDSAGPNGDCGVAYYHQHVADLDNVQHVVLLHDQAILEDYQRASFVSADLNHTARLLALAYFGQPHISHATSKVIAPIVSYSTPPSTGSAGILEDPNNPWTLAIYANGSRQWQSILGTSEPVIATSSDRWLYANFPDGRDVSAMTGGAYTKVKAADGTIVLPPLWYDWLISHDGSAIFPSGDREADPEAIRVRNPTMAPVMDGRADVVHNSELVGDSLPADLTQS